MQLATTETHPPVPAPVLTSVQAAVDTWRAEHDVPGVSVSIRDAGAPLVDVVSGAASLREGRALATSDRMWAGSITKLAVAAAALQLAAEGALSLDDTIDAWHPDVQHASRVTIRMLLDHTSGLPDLTNEPGAYRDHLQQSPLVPWNREQLLEAIVAHPGARTPASSYAYSNANYLLLGDILERTSGQRLDELFQQRLLRPAGATASQLDLGDGGPPTTVAAHAGPGGTVPYRDSSTLLAPGSFTRSTLGAAGGLTSTASDLARIGEAILWRGGAALDDAARSQLLRSADQSEHGYGLGTFTMKLYAGAEEPSRVYGHDGHLGGTASALLLHVPETQQTISIMLPSDPPQADALVPFAQLASKLLDLVNGR